MTDKQYKYNRMYMDIAFRVADMSYCNRKKVGAIAVKHDKIISMGWNGQPTGFPNQCEDDNNVTLQSVLHAESNMLTKLARSHESSEGASVYVTCTPCIDCAKLLAQSGVKEVFYAEEYRNSEGLDFLIKCGIIVNKI